MVLKFYMAKNLGIVRCNKVYHESLIEIYSRAYTFLRTKEVSSKFLN